MNQHYPFVLPPLPYAYDALEPHIDEQTMRYHHDKHLQKYIDNLNAALADHPKYHDRSLPQLLACPLPKHLETAIRRNAGGVYNHLLYFANLSPAPQPPTPALAAAIEEDFGGLGQLCKALTGAAASIFGSGYAWLVMDRRGKLIVTTTANQDTPVNRNTLPLVNPDVWEHAYYLKHNIDRAAYLEAWLQVVCWGQVSRTFDMYSRLCPVVC